MNGRSHLPQSACCKHEKFALGGTSRQVSIAALRGSGGRSFSRAGGSHRRRLRVQSVKAMTSITPNFHHERGIRSETDAGRQRHPIGDAESTVVKGSDSQ